MTLNELLYIINVADDEDTTDDTEDCMETSPFACSMCPLRSLCQEEVDYA